MRRVSDRFWSRAILGSLLALPVALPAVGAPRPACPVVLEWDSIADARIAGYALYYGAAGTPATNRMDVGTAHTVTIYDLSTSVNYSFFVVAYDQNGIESSPSNLLPYSPPALTALHIAKSANGPAWLQFRAAPGAYGRIEYTPSLNPTSWRTLNSATADANGFLIFVDPELAAQPSRFYRAVLP